MGEDLEGAGRRIYDVMRATQYVVPALEIIDYRTEVPRAITDTIADNAAFGAIVVGGRPIRPMDVDIRWVGATLSKNGVIEESGVSAAIMGHPAAGIAWLVNKLHDFGAGLRRGQIVLAGSFTRPVDIALGDVIHADYGPLGPSASHSSDGTPVDAEGVAPACGRPSPTSSVQFGVGRFAPFATGVE
jgi:2-oxo-hept-3-ene-1,7-dioate hydratase